MNRYIKVMYKNQFHMSKLNSNFIFEQIILMKHFKKLLSIDQH
jgi:hypothetical protein